MRKLTLITLPFILLPVILFFFMNEDKEKIKENINFPILTDNNFTNPCPNLSKECIENLTFIDKNIDVESSVLALYLTKSVDSKLEKSNLLTSLYRKDSLGKNCYNFSIILGKKIYIYDKKKSLNYNYTLCRSMIKFGIISQFKDLLSKERSIKLISSLCKDDPEKNGCADGVGRLIFDFGFKFSDASVACAIGDAGVAQSETFYNGCMGGYGNWSRYGDFLKSDITLEDIKNIYCEGIDSRGVEPCLGYGIRSYVRSVLNTNKFTERLNEFHQACMVKKDVDIKDFCANYLGFTLADVYNDKTGLGEFLPGEKLSKKVDYYCGKNYNCLGAFIAWYTNQWAFSDEGILNVKSADKVCRNLTVADKDFCFSQIESEQRRWDERLSKANQES